MNTKWKKIISLLLSLALTVTVFFCVPMTASAANASNAQEAILKVAVNELGYTESGVDNTKYGKWFGAQVAWCCIFISWCANETDLRFGTNMYGNVFPRTGTCQVSMQWYKGRGEFQPRSSGYVPQAGDLIYFNWSSGSNAQHIGIVESVSEQNGVPVVNQLSGNFGNAVKRFSYKLSDTRIIGYATPDYASQGSNLTDSGNGWVPPSERDPDEGIIAFTGAGITTENLNVRCGPSTAFGKLGVLSTGTNVSITGKFSNGWYKINYNNGSAYVCGDYLKLNGNSSVTTTKPTTTAPSTTSPDDDIIALEKTGSTTANLNVRTGPSTSHVSLGVAPKGTRLSITGKVPGSPEWYRVNYNGRLGYACGDYINLHEDETTTAPTTKPSSTTTEKPATTTTAPVTTTKPDDGSTARTLGQATENLNVRTGPSTSYPSLSVVPKGTKLTITGKASGNPVWYQVVYGNREAYVCGTYIKLLGDSSSTTTTTTTTQPSTTSPSGDNETDTKGTGITTANLNLRTGPSTSYTRLLVIPMDKTVEIVDQTTVGNVIWYQVVYGNVKGYVSGDYLRNVQFTQKDWVAMNATMIATEYLNVRTGPSTAYDKIGKINLGGTVKVVGKYSNGWYRIVYNNGYACVCGDYLK